MIHGGTDGGAVPRFDFSTNANALGPNPILAEALRGVDPGPYPDPAYRSLRAIIADRHAVDDSEVVVGAGASELIQRAVRATTGPILTVASSFGEYARVARMEGRTLLLASDLSEMAALAPEAGCLFVCSPNNPDGRIAGRDALDAIRTAAPRRAAAVLDLAYAPLSEEPVPVPPGWWQLHAPNKAHGMTGVRAAHLLADPEGAGRLRELAASWIVSAHGVTFLEGVCAPQASAWVDSTRRILWEWRDLLAGRLRGVGIDVEVGAANFLLARVGDASRIAGTLRRRHGIGVRDATSFGLADHLRLSAQPPAAIDALSSSLEALS